MLYLARKPKSEVMEACYLLFEKANWDLTKVNNDTDLFIEEVRKNAREYIKEVLNKKLTKEQIWCLSPTYVRRLFNDYDAIIQQMLKENVINRQQLMDVDWLISDLRTSIFDFCYNTIERFKWINVDIENYCFDCNMSSFTVRRLADEYITTVLKWDENQLEEYNTKKNYYRKNHHFNDKLDGRFADLFFKLQKTQNNNEIIKLFSDFNRDYYAIRHFMTDFMSSYDISEDIKEDIFKKLQIYSNYLIEKRKEREEAKKIENHNNYIKENYDSAKNMINDYFKGEYNNIEEFCKHRDINRKIFDKYINIIKETDGKLYNDYLKYEEDLKNKKNQELLSNSLIVIKLLKEGVEENGIKRDFDLVDYYKYLPLGFDRMLKFVRDGLDKEDYKLLSTYVYQYKNDEVLSEASINNIYNTKTILGVKVDDKNNIIPGTGREITKEEKENIIKYLKDNNIPVTNKTYNIIYRRWLSGNLVFEKGKEKIK